MECPKLFQRCTDSYGMRGIGICKIPKDKGTTGMLESVQYVQISIDRLMGSLKYR